MLNKTYFAISDNFNPFALLDKWLNPFTQSKTVDIADYPLLVSWTQRAQRILEKRDRPLIVEMQLYFSCVVKKRTIFHDSYLHSCTTVNDKLCVDFRSVEPTSCDPEEFARYYPEKRQLNGQAANRMHARRLQLDFKNNQWVGEFFI